MIRSRLNFALNRQQDTKDRKQADAQKLWPASQDDAVKHVIERPSL